MPNSNPGIQPFYNKKLFDLYQLSKIIIFGMCRPYHSVDQDTISEIGEILDRNDGNLKFSFV